MRKADYNMLASILLEEIRQANTVLYSPLVNAENKALMSARKNCVKRIAHTFAARAGVDRKLFLTACGLEV